MNIVYYSIVPSDKIERQLIQSLRSLRRYNSRIPVHVFYYGSLGYGLQIEAERHRVTLHQMGDYLASFVLDHRQPALASFPTLHKFRHPTMLRAERYLFLDADTFFTGDVAELFASYNSADLYAKPGVTVPTHINDYLPVSTAILTTVCQELGTTMIPAFNSGVMLFNYRLASFMRRAQRDFLDIAWRLLTSAIAVCPSHSDLDMTVQCVTDRDRDRALSYPTHNHWIFEEIATWLAMGRFDGVSVDYFSDRHCQQQGSMCDGRSVVSHYWSYYEDDFFSRINRL